MLKGIIKDWGKFINRKIKPKNIATIKFVAGPAKETLSIPHFWSLKLYGFTGTGFAQPKIGPLPAVNTSKINGKIIVPNGSICLIGFRVNLPSLLAVVSPNNKAILP